MIRLRLVLLWATLIAPGFALGETKPLKALLIAGGCCHDYGKQHKILADGIQSRANIRVDVIWTNDTSTKPRFPHYDKANWADGYDVVIHDECAAGINDKELVKRILDAHKTVPSVHLHCAMHSFRTGDDRWFRHLGLQSTGHGPQKPIEITYVDKDHPITEALTDWTTINEELYNNVKLFDAHPLAIGKQTVDRHGVPVVESAVVAWTNEKQGARSFSTTIGHNNDTVADGRYLDLIVRGTLWACDKLHPEYLTAYEGENEITFVPKQEAPPAETKLSSGPAKDATLVKVTASSTESWNPPIHAVDGDSETRWCASGGSYPQWLMLEFDQPKIVQEVQLVWERPVAYQYRIEGSGDKKTWTLLLDATSNQQDASRFEKMATETPIKFLRITGVGTRRGGYCSIREVRLKGDGIGPLWPAGPDGKALTQAEPDPYQKSGNAPAKIAPLDAQKTAEILRDVKTPEGFDVSLFAAPPAVNYPVFVAAAPNGDLYVSSDGNGSLGRNPQRGRVLRLRDTNGDGRADDVTTFVPDVDSPRGLVWDQDRLYLLHPPHITMYRDTDGDGVADQSQRLVEGIAFGFSDRPADHTTNGLTLGIDGWLYIAGGDFGFLNAKGVDGRTLQHRGGGVIRFRPDGSGLELFSTGTRNILETPISPLLDLFARDNTNDGGGWDVRFHHFTGYEDHGYPRMYINFADEIVTPLADYGGGSGCGGVYLAEPGFPEVWNNGPLTCDWGTGALWKHTVSPRGATFEEPSKPQPLIRMTRPTDADVDGNSRIYQASWKGATFNWDGPDVGYIVRVSPKGYQPKPLPDYSALSAVALVDELTTPSAVRRLAAQRALLSRPREAETTNRLVALANDERAPLEARVAAVFAIAQPGFRADEAAPVIETLVPLAETRELTRFVLRALGDLAHDRPIGTVGPVPATVLEAHLTHADPRTRLEAIIAATRQRHLALAPSIAASLGHDDAVVAHTAFRCLAELEAVDACFAILTQAPENESAQTEAAQTDTAQMEAARTGAARALMRMHRPEVVERLIRLAEREMRSAVKRTAWAALCRLYHVEGAWKGDSWGTRPDTRGPYYQPEPWEQSPRIAAALSAALSQAAPDEAAFLTREMARNRIQSDEAVRTLLALAERDESLLGDAVAQVAVLTDVPDAAIPLAVRAATGKDASAATLGHAVTILARTDRVDGVSAMLTALARLTTLQGAEKERKAAQDRFLGSNVLDGHHGVLEQAARDVERPTSVWADAALLALTERKGVSPEARETAQAAIESGWTQVPRRLRLIQAAMLIGSHAIDDKILDATRDADVTTAQVAASAIKALKIERRPLDESPKVGALSREQAHTQAVMTKGRIALGEQIFTKSNCVACHTVRPDQPLKGPYLGTIARTYKRPDLVTAILDPSKTIAQGFVTTQFAMADGRVLTGFVTNESSDQVTIRDKDAKEYVLSKDEIDDRKVQSVSVMPEGLMNEYTILELASLVDYLESLAAGNE